MLRNSKITHRFHRICFSCFYLVLLLSAVSLEGGSKLVKNEWMAISREELAQEKPYIDPSADAEYLIRKLTYDDSGHEGTLVYTHNKIKIFTDKGIEDLTVLKITLPNKQSRLRKFIARVIQPDGGFEIVKHKELYTKEVVKSEGNIIYQRTVSLPGLTKGCIVEYRYEIILSEVWSPFHMIPLLDEYPTRKLDLETRPYRRLASRLNAFNTRVTFEDNKPGTIIHANILPGKKEEPFNPPMMETEPWVLLYYYGSHKVPQPKEYWKDRVSMLRKLDKKLIKPKDREIVKLSRSLMKDSTDKEEYLRKVYEYCTETLKNVNSPISGFTEEDRKKMRKKTSFSLGKTIQRGYGLSGEIESVFASLVAAAGFEVHFANCERRDLYKFDYEIIAPMNLVDLIICVGEEDNRRYFSPSELYTPFSRISANNRDATCLVGETVNPMFEQTTEAVSEETIIRRTAELELNDNGDISGKITIRYGGYSGLWRKRWLDSKSKDQQKKLFLESYQEQMPSFELSDFNIENVYSWRDDLFVSFNVRIPAYAEAASSWMFLEPCLFNKGRENEFKDEYRINNLEQPYPFEEHDEITIKLPESFSVEETLETGYPIDSPILYYQAAAKLDDSGNVLKYKRTFISRFVSLKAEYYEELRDLFNEVYRQDHQALSLKREL